MRQLPLSLYAFGNICLGREEGREGVTPHADALRTETVMYTYTNLGLVHRASLKETFSVVRIKTSSSVRECLRAFSCLEVKHIRTETQLQLALTEFVSVSHECLG